jgi:hypothetical protein
MNKQIQKQNLEELMRLTLINILNAKGTIYTHYKLMGAKGVIYTYYKQQQERELNENNVSKSKWL